MTILERFKLDGATALVTGGAQGIGKSFARALAEAGANVAVVDLDMAGAEAAAGELVKDGYSAIGIEADVTDEAAVKRMLETVKSTWGGLTIAVNNAGVGMWHDAMEMPLDEWRRILSLNLDAVYLCCREEAKYMAKSSYGKIINTASMSAHISNTPQKQAAYNASKAGVLHLTRSLAAEWAEHGIRVNSISPGYTRTALVDKLLESPEGKQMLPLWLDKIPLGKMAETDDLQGAVCYLAAPVSDYMTGADLLIDGGYCAW